ncbi:MAG TPA: histidine phosphatase family protein [Stellaceae bacterium]|nr:histidine phosphatase family protein [Stellaceae bacterium]
MNRLLLLRHAKAAPQADSEAGDRTRPLLPRGERAAMAVGRWLATEGIAPDLALCSSATRARQTLERVLPALHGRPRVAYEDTLYLAEVPALLARLRAVEPARNCVLLVGHNPGLHELAALLLGEAGGRLARRLRENMPTGALAGFELAGGWTALGRDPARLVHYVTPKELIRDGE